MRRMNKKNILLTVAVAAVAVLVTVLVYTVLANRGPVIIELKADPNKVLPRGTCQIVCNATGSDGDGLIYGWSPSGGTISGQGPAVTWTAPSSTGSYNVTAIVSDNRGRAAIRRVIITVRTNKPPTINNLTASGEWTTPSDNLQVTCNAGDPDGDELSYEWATDGGTLSGTGTVVNWTAPQTIGIYNITVTVRDSYGASVTRTLPISVVTGQPPTIQALNISKDRYGHCYLKTTTLPYKVGQGKKYDIRCIVADVPVNLSYEWTCTHGEITETSEDGSMIAWVAPNSGAIVTIRVIVSDIAGNKSVKDLYLEVAGCTSCIFPGCRG